MALIFISIVGVRVFGNEWRTRTIESAAIAAPIRAELFFAKCHPDGHRRLRLWVGHLR